MTPEIQPTSVHDLTKKNIELIAELDATAKAERTHVDRLIDTITQFCGTMTFVWVHVTWFAFWIGYNTSNFRHFDPFPFNLLTLIVSLEAIILSTFILISQNRQGRLSERRSHLDLQINLLSEQENTKIISMLVEIMNKLDVQNPEPETEVMLESAEPKHMIEQIQEIIEGEQRELSEEDES